MSYLNQLEIELSSMLNHEVAAVVDNDHMVQLNYESFFFASEDEVRQFSESPTEYCGPITDPVSKQRFIPIDSSPSAVFNNRTFYFLSEDNLEMFVAMPDSFALAGFKMMKMQMEMMEKSSASQD